MIDAPVSELIEMTLGGVPDVLFFRWLADYPDPDSFMSGLLHSDDGILSGMCSQPEIDRLCERGRQEHDPALRHATYREIEFLDPEETEALCDAPNRSTWIGRRDRALLSLAIDTGLRVSELTGLRCEDVVLGAAAHVRCQGKGRKERSLPLSKPVQKILHQWISQRNGRPEDPLFPSIRGGSLSRDAVEYLLAKHAAAASKKCPSMVKKRISPHVLRHSTAMNLLYHGVERTVIAMWLGHERVETTQVYAHANLKLKEKILERITPPNIRLGRYRPR